MQKLSVTKQSVIVKQYLGGLSYDEIAAQAEVSKGTVANVVADLKAGHILDAQEAVEPGEIERFVAVCRRLSQGGDSGTGLSESSLVSGTS